jgi:integrase/recombinase XerD
LSGFYAYALDEGLVLRSPVAWVRRSRVSDESSRLGLDREQIRALLDAGEADGHPSRRVALATPATLGVLRTPRARDEADLDIR